MGHCFGALHVMVWLECNYTKHKNSSLQQESKQTGVTDNDEDRQQFRTGSYPYYKVIGISLTLKHSTCNIV